MKTVVFSFAVMMGSSAHALECPSGSPDVFSFEEAFAARQGGTVSVTVLFTNRTERIIRTMHGTVIIEDKAGYRIGEQKITLDAPMIPKVRDRVDFDNPDMARLTDMKPEHIVGTVCTEAIIFEEGDTQKFD